VPARPPAAVRSREHPTDTLLSPRAGTPWSCARSAGWSDQQLLDLDADRARDSVERAQAQVDAPALDLPDAGRGDLHAIAECLLRDAVLAAQLGDASPHIEKEVGLAAPAHAAPSRAARLRNSLAPLLL